MILLVKTPENILSDSGDNKFITISMMGETQNPNSFKLDTGIKGSVFSLSQGDCGVFLRKTFNPLAPEI